MDGLQKNKLIILLNKVLKQQGKLVGDDELIFLCPFHHAVHNVDRKKFGIKISIGSYNCFACGESGKSFKTLFKKLKASPSLYKELYSIIGDRFKPDFGKQREKQIDLCLPEEFRSITIPSKDLEYRHALSYLKKRNITRDDMLRYNIGYCDSGVYRNRIITPSYDANGNLNFFSARDFLNISNLKYLLPNWSKDIIGYELFINWREPITIVEGTFDAISIRKNAIPLFGKIMSNSLKEELLENDVKHINICLDNDAIKNSIRMSDYLIPLGIEVSLVQMDDKDPSVIGFDGINKLIDNTKPLEFSDMFSLKINL